MWFIENALSVSGSTSNFFHHETNLSYTFEKCKCNLPLDFQPWNLDIYDELQRHVKTSDVCGP
jgi:hypothetical protein